MLARVVGCASRGRAAVRIVGRERELASLRAFLAADGGERGLLLVGEAGIGKTALWEAGVASWPGRVLAGAGATSGARTAFSGLAELVAGAPLAGLAEPQRRALEAAAAGEPAEPQAVRLAFLNALRGLAGEGPLLVAVDDLPRLDPPSEAVLAFAVRRLEDAPVRLLLARRPGAASELEAALVRPGLERLVVGPLPPAALRRLVSGADAAAGGNPRLALALARGDEAVVAATLESVVGRSLADVPPAAARLLLAAAVWGDLPAGEAEALAGHAALDEAVEAGVVRLGRGRVRPSHPLLAARARAAAGVPELRAALGHGPVAERLMALAAAALARGDARDAAELARLALLLGEPPGARLLAGETSVEEALQRDPDEPWALAFAALAAVAAVEALPSRGPGPAGARARRRRRRARVRGPAGARPDPGAARRARRRARRRPGASARLARRGPTCGGDRWPRPWLGRARSRHARGRAAFLRQEPAEGLPDLQAVWERCSTAGVDEPGAFPVAPDLVEALVATGDLDAARAVTGRLAALASEQSHPWATVAAAACEALVELDADALQQAAGAFARLDRPLDEARTLLALGSALRRARRWGTARAALERAAEAFDALGEDAWAALARSQLQRVGARRPHARGRADARRAAGRRAGRRRPLEQGDRRPARRHREHRRGAPLARLREARRALAGPAGGAARLGGSGRSAGSAASLVR